MTIQVIVPGCGYSLSMTQQMNFSSSTPEFREQVHAYNESRFHQLNGLVIASSEGAWQYLLTVNGGGAVAVVAFIGAVPQLQKRVWPYVVLAIFAIGLLLVGLGRALVLLHMNKMLQNWTASMAQFYSNKLDWHAVTRADEALVKPGEFWPWLLGWVSFGLFAIGLVFLCVCFIAFGVP
ncbi:hypothetical protein [Variovorax paradoxus]|uniref:hypothetical protein n=1 Tax=Variovorax paradoxus TaxID=34073 RepID=UPI003D65E05E